MLRLFVVVVSMFSSVLFTNELVANQKEKFVPNKISPYRYIVGGIFGTTLGFGSGHSVQGRWWEDYGWVFTTASIITVLPLVFGENCGVRGGHLRLPPSSPTMHVWMNSNYDNCVAAKKQRQKKWVIGFFVTKAIETVSVWWPRNVSFAPVSDKQKPPRDGLTEITTSDYVLGGLAGTVLGFGIGHAVQGRWWADGKMYTFTQLAGAGLTVGGGFSELGFLGIALFSISKIIEMVAVWGPSTERYRVVAVKPKLPFSILPLLSNDQVGLQLVVSLH